MRRRRRVIIAVALTIALLAWLAAAARRHALARSEALAQVKLNFPDPDVRVPFLPLLINPFLRHPKAYLYQDDINVLEIETGR